MADELAAANVNRSYSLAATSIAIFMFVLFFLYPRFVSGNVNAWLFQGSLIVMGGATFAFASFYYYALRSAAGQTRLRRRSTRAEPIALGCSDVCCCSWLQA